MAAKARRRPPRPRAPVTRLSVLDRGRPRTPLPFLRRVVRQALQFTAATLPVSLLLTDDAGIAAIHRDFLGDRRSTDVIAFAIDGEAEIVVSVETAARQSRTHGHALRAEIALYVVHGLLHVCGFDDTKARARVRMRAAERAILAALRLDVAAVDA